MPSGQARRSGSVWAFGPDTRSAYTQHLRRTRHSASRGQAGPGRRSERVQYQFTSRTKFAQRCLSGRYGISQLDKSGNHLRGRLR